MRKNVCIIMAIASLIFFSHFVGASEEIYFYHNDPFGYPVARANEREETGLIFDGSRYYDPEIGRYLTPARESIVNNPYVPKPDEHMKYNNPILTQNHEIAKTKNKQPWKILSEPMWWYGMEYIFQSREPKKDNNKRNILDLLNPISIVERNSLFFKNGFPLIF